MQRTMKSRVRKALCGDSRATMRWGRINDFLNIGLASWGAWALFAQLCILARFDFSTLKNFSFLPFLAFAALLFVFDRTARLGINGDAEAKAEALTNLRLPPWPQTVGTSLVLAALYWATGSGWLLWCLALVHLTLLVHGRLPRSTRRLDTDPQVTVGEVTALAGICVVAVLITLGVHRPDSDDAYFVNVAVSALDSPERSLLTFDGMHGGLPPLEQSVHLLQVYELFVAAVALITGFSVHTLYYVVFPAICTVAGVAAHWTMMRRLLPGRAALLGLATVVAILALWGDGHRTYGNFAFVRLYQGKAAYLFVVLPMIVGAAQQYRLRPSPRNWLFLALHQCAAVGLNINALVVAPTAAGLALLAGPRFTRSFGRTVATGLTASFPLALLAVGMYFRVVSFRSSPQVAPILLGYETVLGTHRTSLVLLGLLLLPDLALRARLPYAGWLCGYIWLVFLLLFCPATATALGHAIADVFSWRIFWAVPVPLLLGLTAGILATDRLPRRRIRLGVLGLWVTAFAVLGSHSVSKENWAWSNVGMFKVERVPYETAKRVMAIAPSGGLALVPEVVAVPLCGFHRKPPLVGVRLHYLKKLRGIIPDGELVWRINLFRYVSGEGNVLTVTEAAREIEVHGITTVALPCEHRDVQSLMDILAGQGFTITRRSDYFVAVRPLPSIGSDAAAASTLQSPAE
jgi:hypothetical protein